jgi:hypothetical protein
MATDGNTALLGASETCRTGFNSVFFLCLLLDSILNPQLKEEKEKGKNVLVTKEKITKSNTLRWKNERSHLEKV